MTEIEQKALALVNKVQEFDCGVSIYHVHNAKLLRQALCRAIEKHEADKAAHAATVEGILNSHEAYKQDVSDAVEDTKFMVETHCDTEALALVSNRLNRFIIPKPTVDPLVEALAELDWSDKYAERLREALAKRGLKIVETGQ